MLFAEGSGGDGKEVSSGRGNSGSSLTGGGGAGSGVVGMGVRGVEKSYLSFHSKRIFRRTH